MRDSYRCIYCGLVLHGRLGPDGQKEIQMNIETTLRLYALITLTVESLDTGTLRGAAAHVAAQEAIALVGDHLLSLGWRNSPEDVPAMRAARAWAEERVS